MEGHNYPHPEKGCELLVIVNWRPLTMLTIDYKIIATVIANRLKPVLTYLISDDQTGFMSGRQISTVIQKTMDVFELAQNLNAPGYVICTDFKKCFDLISYSGI